MACKWEPVIRGGVEGWRDKKSGRFVRLERDAVHFPDSLDYYRCGPHSQEKDVYLSAAYRLAKKCKIKRAEKMVNLAIGVGANDVDLRATLSMIAAAKKEKIERSRAISELAKTLDNKNRILATNAEKLRRDSLQIARRMSFGISARMSAEVDGDKWSPHTNPKTGRKGWISKGGAVWYGGNPENASSSSDVASNKPATKKKKSKLRDKEKKIVKSTASRTSRIGAVGSKDAKKAAKAAKPKRAAPGSQMDEAVKSRLLEIGMQGTFPPADVKMKDIKIADLSKSAEELKYVPLMSWSQVTKNGRISRQRRYTKEFHRRNAIVKFDRVMKIAPKISKIHADMVSKMGLGRKRDRDAAAIASVILETGLRPTDSAESVRHGRFGIASIQARHCKIVGNSEVLTTCSSKRVSHVEPVNILARIAFHAIRSVVSDESLAARFTRRWPYLWRARMLIGTREVIGPFRNRKDAISAELDWIEKNGLKGLR